MYQTQIQRHGSYILLFSFFHFLIFILNHTAKPFNQAYGMVMIILLYSEPICRIVSSWILVAFSYDTLHNVVTHRPELTKVYKLLDPKYLFGFILFFIIPSYLNLLFPFYYSQFHVIKITNLTNIASNYNFSKEASRKRINNLLINAIYVFLNSIIPYILIGNSTTILVKKILKRTEKNLVHRKKRKFVVRIISMNLLFFICNLPSNFFTFYFYYCQLNLYRNFKYCSRGKFLGFYYFFAHLIDYAHRASLLFILLITNKLFRKEFLNTFFCKKI